MRKVLYGVSLQRAVWSPTPFGYDDDSGSSDPGSTPGSVTGWYVGCRGRVAMIQHSCCWLWLGRVRGHYPRNPAAFIGPNAR